MHTIFEGSDDRMALRMWLRSTLSPIAKVAAAAVAIAGLKSVENVVENVCDMATDRPYVRRHRIVVHGGAISI